MKVMVIIKASQDSEAGKMPSEQLMREMGSFNEALVKAGIMVSGDGLYPSSHGYRVRFSGKDRSVINGPFAETKELIAGFWVWQVKSMEEAIEWVKRCPNPMEGNSEVEIRRVFAPEDFAESDPTGEVRALEERLMKEMESYRLEGPRFETLPEKTITGLSQRYTMQTRGDIPELWIKFMPFLGELKSKTNGTTYGVCYDTDSNDSFAYMAGVELKDADSIPAELSKLIVPSQRYAVFTHTKHISKISDTFDAIYSKWLPNSGLQTAQAPVLEKYTADFCPDAEGGIELWIPIKS